MKTLTLMIILGGIAFAQDNVQDAAKPSAPLGTEMTSKLLPKAPSLAPLTDKEKLEIQELRIQLLFLEKQRDTEVPKAISDIQEKINKLIQTLQVSHGAVGKGLSLDLQWVGPDGKPLPAESSKAQAQVQVQGKK